jgi:hypothetical protein
MRASIGGRRGVSTAIVSGRHFKVEFFQPLALLEEEGEQKHAPSSRP